MTENEKKAREIAKRHQFAIKYNDTSSIKFQLSAILEDIYTSRAKLLLQNRFESELKDAGLSVWGNHWFTCVIK